MKNLRLLVVAITGLLVGGGCSDNGNGTIDAGSSLADGSAVADTGVAPDAPILADLAMLPDAALVPDVAPDVPVPVDLAMIADLAPTLPDIAPDLPAFNPIPGHYTVRHDPAFPGDDNSIQPLGRNGFTIEIDADGSLYFIHTIDNWAKYHVTVVNGLIDYQHGEGFRGTGGRHCPTDGFGIEGFFVSPTEARGRYEKLYRCWGDENGYFIATRDPEPDSGVSIDATSSID